MGFTEDDVHTLADKLDELELTGGERAALEAVLVAARADDVAGFATGGGSFAMRDKLRVVLFFDEADALFGKQTTVAGPTSPKNR